MQYGEQLKGLQSFLTWKCRFKDQQLRGVSGKSGGGCSSFCIGPGPSSTTNTVARPHPMCTSKWQCIIQVS
ncbi:hypothetical protein Hdeb2414_s0430g00891881 [Helianthus debilis subsp. tardiflorus]